MLVCRPFFKKDKPKIIGKNAESKMVDENID